MKAGLTFEFYLEAMGVPNAGGILRPALMAFVGPALSPALRNRQHYSQRSPITNPINFPASTCR